MLEFRVLGSFEVVRDGAPVDVPSRRQRALVVRLLLSRGRVVPADDLVDALWDDDPPSRARHALHVQVSRLRALLGPVLVTRAQGYVLEADKDAVDAERFEASVRQAGSLVAREPSRALGLLDEALGLWRGTPYGEFAATFARPDAVRLEELRLTAREALGEALLATGALDRAVGELTELAADHPLQEQPHCLLMRALYLAGRQSEALAVYHRFRKRVQDELGLDPSPLLEQAHEQVLRQDVPPPDPRGQAHAEHRARAPAGAPAPTGVPTPLTALIGRAGELRRLATLAATSRIVTVVGTGGVGKTRLAQEWAATAAAGTDVWWVDLLPAREPSDVPYRLADALGLPEPASGTVEDNLVGALHDVRGLLVLDNCEQVVAAVARITQRIVQRCAGVTVLATSRERLAVAGEQVLFLPPLPAPDGAPDRPLHDSPAVALFADRLRAAGAADLGDDQLPLVAEICRRVGGLPLAIELAAARSRSLGVATVAGRSPLELLTGGGRPEQPSHHSLRAVLDWSHNLMDAEEQILFRRLSVFRGRFTLDEVEDVCPDGVLGRHHIADALAGLVDKSMVAGPERDRYRLLDPIREYSNHQLVTHGEEVLLGAAHARHFVRFAESARQVLYSPREREAASGIADRIDELRAAQRWSCDHDAGLALRLAAALAQYASYHMRFEVQDWAATAAALPDAAGHPLRAVALGSAAGGAWSRGEFARARRLAEQGLEAAGGDGPLAARAMLVLADIAGLEGRFSDAVASYEETVRIASDDEPHLRCEGLGGAAIALCHQGAMDAAVRHTDEGRRIARDVGAPGLEAMSLYFAGEIRMASDPAAALDLLEEARRLAEEVGALFVVGIATLSAVSVRARMGAGTAETLASFRDAIEHWRRVGNHAQQWVTMRNLLPVLVTAGHDELACLLHGALGSAPVQLPADVTVPEAAALAEAVAEATGRLGDGAAEAAIRRGRRTNLDDLVSAVRAAVRPAAAASDQAASSR